MIPSTDHTPTLDRQATDTATIDPGSLDTAAIAVAVLGSIAFRMQLPEPEVADAMTRRSWTTIEEMIAREFIGSYRRYYPKCGMTIRDEAIIAETFDSLTITFEDSRRAVRRGA